MMQNLQAHLQAMANHDALPAPHLAYLEALKRDGFEPRVIYDIGACVLHWTRHVERLWPKATVVLFDAFAPAAFLYKNHLHHVGVLSNRDGGKVGFYQNNYFPGGNSYYREIGCQNGAYFPEDSAIEMPTRTLDSVVQERSLPPPDLVKIDVQGAESDILAGGQVALATTQHLIVELQHTQYNLAAPRVEQSLPFIESLGWRCVAPLFCNNGPDGDYGFVRAI
jgi:FkbM family methyltransferase